LPEVGLDFYQYEDEYSPAFDVAEQLKDSYDVFIVCNNGKATEVQNITDTEYSIIDSEKAFLKVLEREEEGRGD
jgi:subtilase family serine protease